MKNYNKDSIEAALVTIAAVLIIVVFVGGLLFGLNYLFTSLVIWVADGIFGCDLSHCFWQVFVGLILISIFIKPSISINVGGDNK